MQGLRLFLLNLLSLPLKIKLNESKSAKRFKTRHKPLEMDCALMSLEVGTRLPGLDNHEPVVVGPAFIKDIE